MITRCTQDIVKVGLIQVIQWEIGNCSLSRSFCHKIKSSAILKGRVLMFGNAGRNCPRSEEAIRDIRGRFQRWSVTLKREYRKENDAGEDVWEEGLDSR